MLRHDAVADYATLRNMILPKADIFAIRLIAAFWRLLFAA